VTGIAKRHLDTILNSINGVSSDFVSRHKYCFIFCSFHTAYEEKDELAEQIHSMQALTESHIFCQGSAGPNGTQYIRTGGFCAVCGDG
jgi:hypothetical protein